MTWQKLFSNPSAPLTPADVWPPRGRNTPLAIAHEQATHRAQAAAMSEVLTRIRMGTPPEEAWVHYNAAAIAHREWERLSKDFLLVISELRRLPESGYKRRLLKEARDGERMSLPLAPPPKRRRK